MAGRRSGVAKGYVEKRTGSYRIIGSRVSLDSIVYAFWNGQTAESIAQSFPTLTLEQIYGAIAFYLAHRKEIDAALERSGAELEVARAKARETDPTFYQKVAAARRTAPDAQP